MALPLRLRFGVKVTPLFRNSSSTTGHNRLPKDLLARINTLDVTSSIEGEEARTPLATRLKLYKPLEAPEKKALSSAQIGQLQSMAEDLHDVVTEALSTSAFGDLFSGMHDPNLAVHINEVKLNRDCSHAYIKWECDVLAKFAQEAQQEFGNDSAKRFTSRAVKHINKRLQDREAQLRSYIIRHMHFRRVPRLFFAPWHVNLGLKFEGEKSVNRDEVDLDDSR
jgi:hypothetical protein